MDDNAVLEAAGVSKTFRGTGTEIEVLREVDLTVRKSEVVGSRLETPGRHGDLHMFRGLDGPATSSRNRATGVRGVQPAFLETCFSPMKIVT